MRLERASILVESGTGFRTESGDKTPVPITRVTIEAGNLPDELVILLTGDQAIKVGNDILRAGIMSWAEAGVRWEAQEKGFDADGVIGRMKSLVDLALENPPEKPDAT